MTWKKKWILPCLLAVFLTGCQGGKQEIPYISDGSVSWDAVEKAEIYGGGCAVPPTGTISGENGLEELVEAALETEGYRLLPEKEWLEGTMDLWVRFDNGVVIGLYQDANYGYIGTELTLNSPTLIPLIEKWNEMAPMGRMGKPEELESICVYLAGDTSTFTTGSDFVIDGAFTCF